MPTFVIKNLIKHSDLVLAFEKLRSEMFLDLFWHVMSKANIQLAIGSQSPWQVI